jgi:hypothetical protein
MGRSPASQWWRKRRDSNPRSLSGLSLSGSTTHRPAVTARAVWAAQPPGVVARDRHRPRANATTNAITQVPSPAQSPFRAYRAACTRATPLGGPARSSRRECSQQPGARYPSACWPTRRRARCSGRHRVHAELDGGAADHSRRVQVRVDPVGVEMESLVSGGFPGLSGQSPADDRRGRRASWPESGPRLLEQVFDTRDGPRSRSATYSGYWPCEPTPATPATSGVMNEVGSVSPVASHLLSTGPDQRKPAQRYRHVSPVPTPRHARRLQIRLPPSMIAEGPPDAEVAPRPSVGLVTFSIS